MTSLQMTAPSGGSSSTHVSGTMVFALTALGVTAAVYALCNNNNSHRRRGVDGGLSCTLSNPKGSRHAATADGSEEAAQRARTPDGHVPPTPPIKNYFSTRAEAHVKRHSANQVEWYDAALGLNIPFSPILFSVKSEERQAPLVLLTLRYLRQEGHRIAITIEEMSAVMSAEEYKQANMHRIASCSEVLTGSSPSVRIGNSIYPQAEYCYVDETDQLRYVLSVFLTHDRLALSVQYVAPTRVHNIIPTAFYELIRSISFSPPSPTPSYLLVSEPRLGLGFRLSLNFSVYDGLVDGLDAIPDPTLQTDKSSITEVGSSPFATAVRRSPNPLLILAGYGPALPPVRRPRHQLSGSSSDLAPTSPDGSRWIQYLEPQVKASLGHFKLRGPQQPLRFVFREESQADRKPNEPQSGALVIRPLSHRASTRGNFVGLEDDDDDSTSTSAIDLHGAFVLMEVHAEAGSSCLPYLLGDEVYAMDHPSVGGTDAFLSGTSAYVAIFCFPMGDACVLFHFIASTAHLRFADFVAACTSTVQTISLGNHFGQGTSVIYSNTRHEVLPFMCPLPLSGEAENEVRVEEPQLGDPLAVIHIRGVESMTVLVRVFPLPQLEARRTSKSMAKTSTAAVAKMLERVIHGYLANLSEEVSVQQWERFTLNGRPALKLCFELANRGENGVAMDLTSSFGSLSAPGDRAGSVDGAWIDKESVLEDEVGTMNPFARYYPPPPPPASYAGAVGGSTASAGPQSPAGIGRPLIPAGNAASHAPSAGLHNSNLIDGRSPSPSEPRPDDGSEEERLPLRVAVVSCYEHHAFLLMTSASAYTLAVAQHEVVEAASRLSLLYTAMP